ncbi:hypothetical protein [Halogeometricum limi]|uniref:Uncharacterized protein n=1 Tax=Halogeometricum limi TaxID=555875 RepID=A0A1I6FPT9_9EURY|nr:hypothetical protein [Halogeometricum limi]SFR31959.1 hypothetical protein SAMN04488124_0032 [Halogeometricum limi]
MPSPTFPTGTVSGESLGGRTFPPRDGRAVERVRDSPPEAETETEAPTTRRRPESPSTELERLRRENAELRRALQQTRKQRQDVIDRYERLLDDSAGVSPKAADATNAPPDPMDLATAPPTPTQSLTDRLGAEFEELWQRLEAGFETTRRRLERRYRRR